MTAQSFTRNHSDHSNDTGFQFEFMCDKGCNELRSAVTCETHCPHCPHCPARVAAGARFCGTCGTGAG